MFRRIIAIFRRAPCEHDWFPVGYFWLDEILVGIDECSICQDVLVRSQ